MNRVKELESKIKETTKIISFRGFLEENGVNWEQFLMNCRISSRSGVFACSLSSPELIH